MAAPKATKATKATRTAPAAQPQKAAAGKAKPAVDKAKASAGPAGVVVDKALEARWQEALARYRRARTEETEGWDARYEALGDILDSEPPYYLAGGHRSASAFLKAEAPDQDERTVRTYIRVARYFDPEDESRFGIAKLDLLLRYLEAAGGVPVVPAKLHPEKQKVKVPDGKALRAVPFAECSADDLRRAARAAAGAKNKTAPSLSPPVKALKALLAQAKLASIGISVRGGRVDLTGIEWENLSSLGKVLATAKLGAAPPSG